MKDSIVVNWAHDMVFEAQVDGFSFSIDTKKENGGTGGGPRPKPLAMVSLAGCTAMDVISILKKMRVEPEEFSVAVEGTLADEHPRIFTAMHLIYTFKGKNLPEDKLKKAIDLSIYRYCGVYTTYKKAMELSYEMKLV